MSSNDLRLHFGLGDSAKVQKVVVDWPSPSSSDTFGELASGQFLEITEGEGITARSLGSPAE